MPKKNYQLDKKNLSTDKFYLRHTFRAGGVVWVKHEGEDYYLVFRSLTKPSRGIQLPGGRVERRENMSQTAIRETKEETGLDTRILCPLCFMYVKKPEDNYSNLHIYYILKPTSPVNVSKKWLYIDEDPSHQQLECWFVPITEPLDFLAPGQAEVIKYFKRWLEEHKKPHS